MNRNRRTAILSLALLAAAALATAAPSATAPALSGRFPESADIRGAYWQSFFSASESELLRRQPSTVVNDYGAFRLSVTKSEGYLYAIASPEGAPLYAQGSWILKRSSPDGRPIQAKVFLRSDQGTFIRIYPDGDRSKMDLVVYGGVLNREVPLPVPFERCFVATMSEIRAWTGSLVDWRLFSPEPGLYRDLRSFVEVTRQRLPGLRYGDDGALGADGMPVYIETGLPQAAPSGLNCSGFAAWVADGFYWPMTEKLLDPMALAVRHADTRPTTAAERFEERLDPYFGLDWTRNIATALLDANYPSRKHGLRESDVTVSPFALVASGAGLGSPEPVNGASAYRSYAAYQEGLGYETVARLRDGRPEVPPVRPGHPRSRVDLPREPVAEGRRGDSRALAALPRRRPRALLRGVRRVQGRRLRERRRDQRRGHHEADAEGFRAPREDRGEARLRPAPAAGRPSGSGGLAPRGRPAR